MIQRLQKTNKTYIDKNGTLWQVRRTDEGYNCFFHFGTERLSVGWQEGRLPRRKKAWESQKDLDIYAENH